MSQDQIREIFPNQKPSLWLGYLESPKKTAQSKRLPTATRLPIIPVNPFADEVLGEKSYKSLLDIPVEIQKAIDLVDIFRKPENVLPIVEQALQVKTKLGRSFVV